MLATILGDTRADGLAPEHAAIVLEFVLADALDALEAALGCRLSIAGLYDVGPHAPCASSLAVTAEVGDLGPLPCEIALPPRHALRLAALLDRAVVPPSTVLDLDLHASLRVAAAALSLGSLRALAPGDVVLVEQVCLPEGTAVLVIAEHLVAHASVAPDGCRLITRPARGRATPWEWSMEDHIDPTKSSRLDDAAVDAIPVRVVFELGRVELPLKELAALAPGALVPLARPLDEALDVVANGRRIGHGTLVRIGESLGVRITRLFEHA
jgi:type III secretion protein Q